MSTRTINSWSKKTNANLYATHAEFKQPAHTSHMAAVVVLLVASSSSHLEFLVYALTLVFDRLYSKNFY